MQVLWHANVGIRISSHDSSTGIAAAFARLVATLDYPLYVVTTAVNNEPTGCLIGFATQCSIHPPRFLACISKKNHTFQLARDIKAGHKP